MRKPIVLISLGFIAGILAGHAFLYLPLSLLALLSALTFGVIILVARSRLSVRLALLIAVPCLAGMASYVHSAASLPPDHYSSRDLIRNRTRVIAGRIVTPLDRDPGRTSFTLSVQSIDGEPRSGALRVSVRDEDVPFGYGDVIRASGKLFPPRGFSNPGGFDYPRYLGRQGIYAILSVKDRDHITVVSAGRGLFRTVQDWRERIRQSFQNSTSGPGRAILQAMILGEEGGLTEEVRDRFMTAGVTHILSISGSHLGLIAVVCFVLVRQLLLLLPEPSYHRLTVRADPGKMAAAAAVLPVTFYALLAGGQVATIRSLVMILCGLAALVLDRQRGLLYALAAAALAILIPGPQALFDISFQLSFLSVAAILAVVHVWNELRLPANGALEKLRNSSVLLIAVSLATTVATAPMVALYFNQLSLAGIVSNMVIVPLAGFVLVPLGLLSGVLSLAAGPLPFAGLNQHAADFFYAAVSAFARLPAASFRVPSPGPVFLLSYAVLVISGAFVLRTLLLRAFDPLASPGRPSRPAVAAMTAASLAVAILFTASLLPQRTFRTTFLDVGQGDCALIETPAGKRILIDGGGTRDNRFDVGKRVVAPFLWNRGIRTLDLLILSHPHPDHMNGLTSVLKNFAVREVWDSGFDQELPGYGDFLRALREQNAVHTRVPAGAGPASVGDARLSVLHPKPGFSAGGRAYAAENNRSLVVSVEVGERTLLFPGDVQAEAEAALLASSGAVRCDVLKVAHHGGKTSSTEPFLRTARPSIAVISLEKDNWYGQPGDEVLERFYSIGARLYRTDRDGAVTVGEDGKGMRVTAWADRLLLRIRLKDPASWVEIERENWRRLRLRARGI